MEAFEDTGLRIFPGNIGVATIDDQLGAAQQLFQSSFNLGQALAVLEALVVKDALDDLLLGHRDVLPDVLFGALVHQQIADQARVFRQDDAKLVAPHALHPLQRFVARVFAKGGDDVNRQFLLTPEQPVIHFS